MQSHLYKQKGKKSTSCVSRHTKQRGKPRPAEPQNPKKGEIIKREKNTKHSRTAEKARALGTRIEGEAQRAPFPTASPGGRCPEVKADSTKDKLPGASTKVAPALSSFGCFTATLTSFCSFGVRRCGLFCHVNPMELYVV